MQTITGSWAGWLVLVVAAGCGSGGGATSDVDATQPAGDTVVADSVTAVDAADTELAADTEPAADALATRAEWPPPATVGGARPAKVLAPAGYDGYTAAPAVILLGGYDYFARDLDDWIELSKRVDGQGFFLVLPDGLVDQDGSPYWNATDTCCDYYASGVDDVGYLTGVIDELEARFKISGVGLVGHSAGGFMAYRLACEIPTRLGGLVSLAGSGFRDENLCAIRDVPLAILQVHGSADDVMPFDGDDEAPGALEMLGRWGGRDGCALASWKLESSHIAYAEEGATRVGHYTGGCTSGADVRLWYLEGSDHYPTYVTRFTDDLLAWLLPRLR